MGKLNVFNSISLDGFFVDLNGMSSLFHQPFSSSPSANFRIY